MLEDMLDKPVVDKKPFISSDSLTNLVKVKTEGGEQFISQSVDPKTGRIEQLTITPVCTTTSLASSTNQLVFMQGDKIVQSKIPITSLTALQPKTSIDMTSKRKQQLIRKPSFSTPRLSPRLPRLLPKIKETPAESTSQPSTSTITVMTTDPMFRTGRPRENGKLKTGKEEANADESPRIVDLASIQESDEESDCSSSSGSLKIDEGDGETSSPLDPDLPLLEALKANVCKSTDEVYKALQKALLHSGRAGKNCERIKRPLNAFMVWSKIQRNHIMSLCPKQRHHSEISRALGNGWKSLSDKQKFAYYDIAKRLRLVNFSLIKLRCIYKHNHHNELKN